MYDFHIDGLLVVRRADISEIESKGTDAFQTTLLQDAGLLTNVQWDTALPIDSWPELLSTRPPDSIVILEREDLSNAEFWIGRIRNASSEIVQLQEFTGAGRWLDDLTEVPLAEVTCCQIGTRHIRFYEDDFSRTRC